MKHFKRRSESLVFRARNGLQISVVDLVERHSSDGARAARDGEAIRCQAARETTLIYFPRLEQKAKQKEKRKRRKES